MSDQTRPPFRSKHSDSTSASRRDLSIGRITSHTENIETPNLTPEQYADAVRDHSWQTAETSLYPGHNFQILARYLRRDFEQRTRASVAQSRQCLTPTKPFSFISAYAWDGVSSWGSSISYQSPSQCVDLGTSRDKPTIVFLRGKPSSMWLSTLGAALKVDPEFFNNHLDFYTTIGRFDCFSSPALPSEHPLMFHVPYITIGQMNTSGWQSKQSMASKVRLEAATRMNHFHNAIYDSFSSDCSTGESLVRDFHVHDQTTFALEQRMSIALCKTAKSWQLLIWLDTGKPLSQSPVCAPWHGSSTSYPTSTLHGTSTCPAIRTSPSIALKSHMHKVKSTPGAHNDLAQNISLLHQQYGQHLDAATMAVSPFYALYDVLHFAATTYRRYFNMLESKNNQRTNLTINGGNGLPPDDPENWDSTGLRHDRAILETYVPQLRSTLEVIHHRGNSGPAMSPKYIWPNSPKDMAQEARIMASVASLKRDYEDLIAQAERLLHRYNEDVSLLMNRAVTAEASKSVEQAREVTKLTRLAFVYIPLSFTCSFFGMNVNELSHWAGSAVSQQPPLWLWVVVSAPFLLFSLVILNWNLVDVWRSTQSRLRSLVKRDRGDKSRDEVEKQNGEFDAYNRRDLDSSNE